MKNNDTKLMNRIRYIKLMDKCNYNRIETAAYLINKLRETLLEMKPLIQEHERQGGTVDSFFQEEIRKIDEEFLLYSSCLILMRYSNN